MSVELFLDKHQKEKTELKVFIANGSMLTGKVVSYDDLSITLNKCLIFRSKIISITPA